MKLGSTVRLTYTGTLKDGTVFGTAKASAPMEFQTGMDMTIDGFEREILKMEEGERKTFTVGMYDAYGEYLDGNVAVVPVENIPLRNLEVGMRIWLTGDDGQRFPVKVMDLNQEEVTFDMNHPLAGQDLTYDVEILSVEEPEEGWEPPKKHDHQEYFEQLGL